MTTTRHGHHIPGTTFEDEEGFVTLRRTCDGPGVCHECSDDAVRILKSGEQPINTEEVIQFFEDTSEYDSDPDRYIKLAKLAVVGSYNSTHEVPDQLEVNQLYIVWFAKTLSNWKALLSTSVPGDGLYFEVSYSGEKLETYVDTYKKEDNQVFSHHDH